MSATKTPAVVCACGYFGTLEQIADHECPKPPPTQEELGEKLDRIESKLDYLLLGMAWQPRIKQ